MSRIIVYVSGGNVQDIIADCPGLQVMLVDYDNEEAQAEPERSFEEVRQDPSLFSRTMAGKELSSDS